MSLPATCPVSADFSSDTIYSTDEHTRCHDAVGSICSNSKSVRILEEFRRFYEERLSKIDDETPEGMELKLKTLSSWVNDLGEQNLMLVETVEQLEQEAAGRVALLEERLKKSSHIAVEYMKKLEEYDNQFLDLSDERIQPLVLPIETSSRLVQAQQTEEILKTRISNLQNDISGLLELIRRARCEGCWDVNGLSFLEVTYEDIFGPYSHQLSNSFESLGDMQSRINLLHQNFGKHLKFEDYHGKDQEVKVLREKVASQQADITLKDIKIKNLLDKLEELQCSIGNKTKEVLPFSEEMVFDHRTMSNIFSGVEEQVIASLKQHCDGSGVEVMDLSTLMRKLDDTDIQLQTTQEENKLLLKENGSLSSDLKDQTDKIAVLSQNLTKVDKTLKQTREHLTSEIVEKHEQLLALKHIILRLEKHILKAEVQNRFKDAVIKEMRKDIRIAHSKLATQKSSVTCKNMEESNPKSGLKQPISVPSSCLHLQSSKLHILFCQPEQSCTSSRSLPVTRDSTLVIGNHLAHACTEDGEVESNDLSSHPKTLRNIFVHSKHSSRYMSSKHDQNKKLKDRVHKETATEAFKPEEQNKINRCIRKNRLQSEHIHFPGNFKNVDDNNMKYVKNEARHIQ